MKDANDNAPQYRISSTAGWFMMSVAIVIDVFQVGFQLFHFLPFAGSMVAFLGAMGLASVGGLVFFFWFHMIGVSQIESQVKNPGTTFVLLGIEMMPLLNIVPALSIKVFVEIINSRKEDRREKKKHEKKVKNSSIVRQQKMLNAYSLSAQNDNDDISYQQAG